MARKGRRARPGGRSLPSPPTPQQANQLALGPAGPPTSGGSHLAVVPLNSLEKVRHPSLQRRSKLMQRRHRSRALPKLNLRDQAHRKPGSIRKLLERQRPRVSQFANSAADDGVEAGFEIDEQALLDDCLL